MNARAATGTHLFAQANADESSDQTVSDKHESDRWKDANGPPEFKVKEALTSGRPAKTQAKTLRGSGQVQRSAYRMRGSNPGII